MSSIGRQLKQRALQVQNSYLNEAISRVDDALESESRPVEFQFTQEFFQDRNNRAELVARLQKKGFQVEDKKTLVICSTPCQDAPVSTVVIANVNPGEFQMRQPLPSKKLHPVVVMGRHSSVSRDSRSDVTSPREADAAVVVHQKPASAPEKEKEEHDAQVINQVSEMVGFSPRQRPPVITVPTLSLPKQQDSTVDMADFLKLDPVNVRDHFYPRADCVSVRARAAAKFHIQEIKAVTTPGGARCAVCELSFDLFRSPDKCSECKKIVCTHCSVNLPYLEALTGQDSCVCSDCWSTVRVKLEVRAQDPSTTPSDKQLALSEISSTDKLMNLEPDDRLNLAERVLLNNAAKSNPGLPQETLRNLALSDAKGIKCPCCTRHMDIFRRPCVCGKCKMIVCAGAACVRVVNEVLEGSAFACCRNCWREVRVALVDKQKHKPDTFSAIQVELEVGDKFLMESSPGTALHLENAFDDALKRAEEVINERRKAEHNSRMVVAKSPRVAINPSSKSIKTSKDVVLMPQVSPRGDVISPRAVAASKFSTDEAKEVGSKKVVCRRCQLPFSLFRSPDKCGECGYAVCSKCSFTLPHLHEFLGQDGTTCSVCWDMVRVKLFARAKGFPVLSARVDKEVALGDRVLFHSERTTQAERVLRARAKESANEKSWGMIKLSEDDIVERYVKKQSCNVCSKHFDIFRRPSLCTECHSIVCAGATCVRVVAHNEKTCCRNCWPELRSVMEKTASTIVDRAEFETLAMDMAFGDKFLLDLHFSKPVHLQEASAHALEMAQALIAKFALAHHENIQSSTFVDPHLTSSAEVSLLHASASLPDSGVSARVLAFEKFSAAEKVSCEKGKLKCTRCKEKFGVFRAPDKCAICADPVCARCSFVFPHLHQLLPDDVQHSSCICSQCWDDKLRLRLKTLGHPKALQELKLGDEVLYTEPQDRVIPGEVQLAELKTKRGVENKSLDEFVCSLQCPLCSEHYSMWNKPTACSHCKAIICTRLLCVKFIALVKDAPICCHDCWPNVRRDLHELKNVDTDEIDMERALGDKLFLEHQPRDVVDVHVLLAEAEKEGRSAITKRDLGMSTYNLLE